MLLISRFIATLGDQMVRVAVGWQLYERTHQAFALGLVGLAEVLPVILLSLPAGHLSDHADRKRIVLATKFGLSLCSLGLALLSFLHGPLFLIYACIVGIGIGRAYQNPASSTLLPQTVPPEVFTNAVTWNSNTWQLAAVFGPAFGGAVIATSHSATPAYLLDFVLSLVFIGMIAAIKGKQIVRAKESLSIESIVAGIRFLREARLLLAIITLDLFAVLLGGATALLPIFAKDILHVGPTKLGWMYAAPSIGAVVMAASLTHLPPMKRAGMSLLWAVAGFGLATIIFGLSRSFPLSLLMLLALGALDNISVVIRSTLMLLRTPDEMRGRISAVNSIFIGASNELGAFESGAAAALVGPIIAVVGGGIGTILVVIATAFIWPEIRELKEMRELGTEEALP